MWTGHHGRDGGFMDTDALGASAPPSPPRTTSEHTIRSLSDRLVALQRPLRVLESIQWDEQVEQAFLAHGGRELPPVAAEFYARRPLRFDPERLRNELSDLERDVLRRLGRDDPAGRLLRSRCRVCRTTAELLACRGTPAFAQLAGELYGRPGPGEDAAVEATFHALARSTPHHAGEAGSRVAATQAATILSDLLRPCFPWAGGVRVTVSDTLLADAAAGGRSIRLRRGAYFSHADLALLAVHEGWVHVGTTLSGRRQTVCTFLAHAPPSTAVTQEGLAVACEALAGVCHGGRVRRLLHRYRAVRMAQAGANFLDVYRHFLDATDDPRDSYHQAARVFRGSLPAGGGPFTKDLSYALGLVRVVRAVRATPRHGVDDLLRLLFCGKTALDELEDLRSLLAAGVVRPAAFVPPPAADGATRAHRLGRLTGAPSPLPPPHFLDVWENHPVFPL